MKKIALLLALLLTTLTQVQADSRRDPRDELALLVAVIAAHEGALDNINEVSLVWQVAENRASTTHGRLKFLRAHSPKALGLPSRKGPCLPGENCEWSSQLLHAPDRPPAALSESWWNAVRADDWELVRRKAIDLVYGIDLWRPCYGSPYSWGYAGDLKSAWIKRRMVPLGCEGVMNDGFSLAPKSFGTEKTVSAKVARGSSR